MPWDITKKKLYKRSRKMKKLYRNKKNVVLGGVCSGLGDYLNIDLE